MENGWTVRNSNPPVAVMNDGYVSLSGHINAPGYDYSRRVIGRLPEEYWPNYRRYMAAPGINHEMFKVSVGNTGDVVVESNNWGDKYIFLDGLSYRLDVPR